MANTITRQVIENGPRNYVVKFSIVGDGSGDEVGTRVNAVTGDMSLENSLLFVQSALGGFSARLLWDASTDVFAAQIPADAEVKKYFRDIGGIANNAGAGKTGDLLITTSGLVLGETGTLTVWIKKKAEVLPPSEWDLLLENGSGLLLENGGGIKLENSPI